MGYSWAADRDETSRSQLSGSCLLCRVGHPFQSGVVVNVPASLHGDCDASIWRANPLFARRWAIAPADSRGPTPVQGMQSSPWTSYHSTKTRAWALGQVISLTSRRYRVTILGKVRCCSLQYDGSARKRSWSESRAIRIICLWAELLIHHPER
jgi:hypothetical protein